MVDEHGAAVILKNNVSRYIVIDFGKEIIIILSCIELIGSYVKGMARVESDIDIVVDSGLRGLSFYNYPMEAL